MIVKNKKIKTLVCILGQTRAQDITWKNFNKYLLKSLNADLALCVAEKKSSKNQMYKNAKFIWKYNPHPNLWCLRSSGGHKFKLHCHVHSSDIKATDWFFEIIGSV